MKKVNLLSKAEMKKVMGGRASLMQECELNSQCPLGQQCCPVHTANPENPMLPDTITWECQTPVPLGLPVPGGSLGCPA